MTMGVLFRILIVVRDNFDAKLLNNTGSCLNPAMNKAY